MPRYVGTVAQSILDYYAAKVSFAHQWFTQATACYWGFTLRNNATDGTALYVYDCESVSGAAFPAGTGNPGGNPAPITGSQSYAPPATNPSWALVSLSNGGFGSGSSTTIAAPASIVAGNLLLLVMASVDLASAFLTPPDATWIRLGGVDGSATTAAIATFAHIATASEPSTYTIGLGGNTSDLSARIIQFSGVANPAAGDATLGAASTVGTTVLPAPGVFTTAAADLLYCVWVVQDGPSNTFVYPPGFASLGFLDPATHSMHDGYIPGVAQGNIGPFVATNASTTWTALTTTIKGTNPGSAPAQFLSGPTQTLTPLLPGIFTMQFSPTPIALTGITKWIPPASHLHWSREAPIAIVQPGTNFNIAGIAPEFAAWASMTWLAIK